MIKYKKLRWSNAFSYGPDNEIDLQANALTQLVGRNGHGKSSIALILEEVQFNTNSKKTKRSSILNRYTNSKNYTISLDFDKDNVPYTITTTRTATTGSVVLMRDGIDISSHTATSTYKAIEEILGYDHKTFSQIVYQSSTTSLEFLTAPDTARKKFLIELLNLSKYTKASDVFKELASVATKELEVIQTRVDTVSSWVNKYKNEDFSFQVPQVEPEYPLHLLEQVAKTELKLLNIKDTNTKITKNNTYKASLANVPAFKEIPEKPDTPVTTGKEVEAQILLRDTQKEKLRIQKLLAEGSSLAGTKPTSNCKTCMQTIDNSTRFNMFTEFEKSRPSLETLLRDFDADIIRMTNSINANNKIAKEYQEQVSAYNAAVSAAEGRTALIEKYTNLIDTSLPEELLDPQVLQAELTSLESSIKVIEGSISDIKASNKLVEAHNTKITVLKEQLADMSTELGTREAALMLKAKELAKLQVLVKAFSPTGLIAYKIECLVKGLEELTNSYLNTLSDGRFQLAFKIASSDKLNVVITDNGKDVDIAELSMGERARVNISALLAIRSLMQSLSNSRTNLLILDETVENLDAEGKEKLIEVLLEETSLNTFIISHGFSHPLLEKINVIKENNISRIEK